MSVAVITFGEKTEVAKKTYRGGYTGERLLSAVEYKRAHDLKGSEGKRAYNQYLRENGKANTAGLAAALTTGELLVKGYRPSKNGLQISLLHASMIKDPSTKSGVSSEVAALAREKSDLQKELAELKAKMAGKETSTAELVDVETIEVPTEEVSPVDAAKAALGI